MSGSKRAARDEVVVMLKLLVVAAEGMEEEEDERQQQQHGGGGGEGGGGGGGAVTVRVGRGNMRIGGAELDGWDKPPIRTQGRLHRVGSGGGRCNEELAVL
jgi:hypothetical protein